MQYLLIQNQFEGHTDGFTTLGLSTSNEKTIGKFGSGSNHGILCFLRAGLDVIIFCGKTKLTFSTKTVVIDEDGIGRRETKRVTVKKGYNMERVMDIDLNFGANDWTNVGMGLREFISNAIDRHAKVEGEGYEPALEDGRLAVELVNERQIRAKSGYTRVYVQVNDEVRAYFANLGQNFLHFSDNPENVHKGLIPRSSGPARIYRCGVFVMQVEEEEGNALFDYNFSESEIEIDESRNSSIYTVRASCADKLRRAEKEEIAIYLKSLVSGSETFESKLEPDRILRSWSTASDVVQANWAAAAKAAFGEVHIVSNGFAKGKIQKSGGEAVIVANSTLVTTLGRLGVPVGVGVLSDHEAKGTEVFPATTEAQIALDIAWEVLERAHGTNGKDKPGVLSFRGENEEKESYLDGNVVHLEESLAARDASREALRQLLSYVEKNYSRRTDFTLDLLLNV